MLPRIYPYLVRSAFFSSSTASSTHHRKGCGMCHNGNMAYLDSRQHVTSSTARTTHAHNKQRIIIHSHYSGSIFLTAMRLAASLSNLVTLLSVISCEAFQIGWNSKHAFRHSLAIDDVNVNSINTCCPPIRVPNDQRRRDNKSSSSTALFSSYMNMIKRRNVKLPILDLSVAVSDFGSDEVMTTSNTLTPLPSSHLPEEISTLNIYGVEFKSPSHIQMLHKAVALGSYGHVVWRPDVDNSSEGDAESSLVGAIGCAVDIVSCSLLNTEEESADDDIDSDSTSDEQQMTDDISAASGASPPSAAALMRGSFRFVVKEVISTFPYPVVIVDELFDHDYANDLPVVEESDDDNDDDDEDDDYGLNYNLIPPKELPSRCIQAMDALVKMRVLEEKSQTSPLEDMILELQGVDTSAENDGSADMELAAVFDVFRSELVEFTDASLRNFAIGMMAVEVGELSYEQRKDALVTTDGSARLRMVLQAVETKISMERAKKMAQQLTESSSDEKELKVGHPAMPPWAKSINAGTRLEYFWNEDNGWCPGTVKEKLQLGDELLLTIKFDDDGSEHRISFLAEEKVRWRPL